MSNQYSQRYRELVQQFCAGVDRANEYRSAGNIEGFIAQVRANQDVAAQRDAVWAVQPRLRSLVIKFGAVAVESEELIKRCVRKDASNGQEN